jgi:hypothetical protein
MEKKNWSIRSGQDLAIALGTLVIAMSVMALIAVPAMSSVLPAVVAGSADCDCENCTSAVRSIEDMGCDTKLELPAGSVIWMCQYLVYSNETGYLIGINLCDDDDWEEYGRLITELTGLENQEEWDILYADMLLKKPYLEEYFPDQGFCILSCLDCDCFWCLIDKANERGCPVKIVMYDCCCTVLPIIPVFIY